MLLNFAYGTQSGYDGIQTKDQGTLYFTTDTKKLYKGNVLYNGVYEVVSEFPEDQNAEGNIIYIKEGVGAKVWDGTKYIELTRPIVQTISDSATHNNIPTSKAVADFINSKIQEVTNNADADYVTGVTFANANGNLTVTKGDDSTTTTTLTAVAHNIQYTAENRIITIPMYGGENLVINLGKDAVVKSGSYNAASKQIELVLTSGDPVNIPVASLIDIYTGEATGTASVSVSADNKISVNVKVSQTAGNLLTTDGTGLYVAPVDQSGKMDKVASNRASEVLVADASGNASLSGKKVGGATLAGTPNANTLATEAAVNAVKAAINSSVAANTSAIATLNGEGAGSVKKAVNDAKTELNALITANTQAIAQNTQKITNNTNAITVLNGAETQEGSVAKAAADTLAAAKLYADSIAETVSEGLSWKTF